MGMVRIYDLATAFRLTTKEVLERLRAGGIEALTFSSTVDEEQAREILSQPVARIAAHAIRPGTGGAAAKPPARKSTRSKPAAGGEAAKVAPKRQPRAKPATGGEGNEKEEPKPRAPRKRPAASAQAKPLVVTLEAPTLEHAPAPPVEVAVAPPPAAHEPVIIEIPRPTARRGAAATRGGGSRRRPSPPSLRKPRRSSRRSRSGSPKPRSPRRAPRPRPAPPRRRPPGWSRGVPARGRSGTSGPGPRCRPTRGPGRVRPPIPGRQERPPRPFLSPPRKSRPGTPRPS